MMNKYKRIILLCCTILFAGLSMYYQTGPAQNGQTYPGAPFVNGGQNCNSCHNGGTFNTSVVIQLIDGSNNPVTTYVPNTAYTLRITINGINILGSTRYGFQAIAAYQTSNLNINGWGTMPANTHNLLSGGRNYAEQTDQLASNIINIPWTAPASTNPITFYASGNIVNNDNGSGGDRAGNSSLTITSGCATIAMTPANPPSGTANVAYSQQLSQTGGVGTVTYALTSGTMPPGTSVSGTGLISGTPTTPGTYNFTITATGSNGCSSAQAFTIVINCPTITLTPAAGNLPGATVATAYSQTIGQTGGSGTFTYTVTSGTLPPGITLNTNGTLSGTPLTSGTYTFTVTGTNTPCSANATYTIVVGCPTITLNPSTLPNGTTGVSYSQTITQSGGGSGAYTYAITSGSLPTPLVLNTNGTISGIPNASGSYTFSVTATGTQSGCSVTQSYTIVINCPAITVNPATLPNGTVGTAYPLTTLSQTGGTNPTTYAVTTGTLPPGLTLAPNGALTGTPTTPGTYPFTVTSTSQFGCTSTRNYSITISCPVITINPATLPGGTTGTAYNQTITQTGGTGVTYAVTTGTLPTGLTLNPTTGALTGTPTATGSYTFTVTGTAGTSTCTGTRTYTIVISCPAITITPASLPIGNDGIPYNQNITSTGGTGTIDYTVSSGTLPSGITLGINGTLSGTHVGSGTFTFTVTATDDNNCTGTITYNWVISPCAPITINPATLPNGTPGTAYSQTITQTGGTGTFTYTVTSGTLPPGLTLNPTTGALAGTPTTPGSYTFTITGVSGTCSGNRTYTLVINCPAITLAPGTLPVDTVGEAYNETITQTGSLGTTFTYTVSSGTLPPGITLNTNGTLSGTGTTTGTYTFDITMTDDQGCSATTSYTIDVLCPVIVIDQTEVDTAFLTVAYNETLSTTGGTAPHTYAVTSGTLPTGITMGTDGVFSGTATAPAGTYTVTVTVTDANGCTATQVLDIIVAAPVSVVSVNGNKESVILLPNIVTDKTTAQINSTVTGKAEIRILDITGKVVYTSTTILKAGENRVDLDLHTLAAGTYTLHVKPVKVAPVKFIKQ